MQCMIRYDALTLLMVHLFSFYGLILCSCSIGDFFFFCLFTFPSERTNLEIHGHHTITFSKTSFYHFVKYPKYQYFWHLYVGLSLWFPVCRSLG